MLKQVEGSYWITVKTPNGDYRSIECIGHSVSAPGSTMTDSVHRMKASEETGDN